MYLGEGNPADVNEGDMVYVSEGNLVHVNECDPVDVSEGDITGDSNVSEQHMHYEYSLRHRCY